MAEHITCQFCEHCDTKRVKENKVRCKKHHKWVNPQHYTCEDGNSHAMRKLYLQLKSKGLI